MRMLYDLSFENIEVSEVWSITAIPAWSPADGSNESVPDVYSVSIFEPTTDGARARYIGTYKLDGSRETYEAARRNFEEIATQAAQTGFFKTSQFERFEWY